MYNLTVATAHTYFVGEGAWLVHNHCKAIVLGRNTYAPQFAEKNGGHYYTDWDKEGIVTFKDILEYELKNGKQPSSRFFEFQFPTAMENANTVKFTLGGIEDDIEAAIRNGAKGPYTVPHNFTNHELYLILTNRAWYDKTIFYAANGVKKFLPFLGD